MSQNHPKSQCLLEGNDVPFLQNIKLSCKSQKSKAIESCYSDVQDFSGSDWFGEVTHTNKSAAVVHPRSLQSTTLRPYCLRCAFMFTTVVSGWFVAPVVQEKLNKSPTKLKIDNTRPATKDGSPPVRPSSQSLWLWNEDLVSPKHV